MSMFELVLGDVADELHVYRVRVNLIFHQMVSISSSNIWLVFYIGCGSVVLHPLVVAWYCDLLRSVVSVGFPSLC